MLRMLGRFWFTLMALLTVASLSLNIGILAVSTIATKASMVFEALTGTTSMVTDLRNQLKAKEMRISSLSDEVASLRQPKVTYRGKPHLIKDAVSDTADRVSKRTAIAASRSASSVVAESIPYLGIAAIIGVAAWDIKDSCQTLKDLSELDLAFNPDKEVNAQAAEVCGMELPKREDIWASVKANASESWHQAGTYVPDLPDFEWPSLSTLAFWQ
ncbi:hypothetical protein [Thalassobacter stenotrophicus]|uniref:Uncharacterized protein n=2 Tax=Thalassobacter stenotrophicus TaxID=266809 RepID=A0A0P1F1R3_9RHOB|nr:hypothetical protein [Thalassobacter stenotrophicus]CUH61550.1 hypothetical protein THS5294_02861 [Thalassobacter stenotrophicus]SHJ07431.1 hypothetical protein SAMN02744035_02499 [Thalassobacter stenotrophicus DSM 16310]